MKKKVSHPAWAMVQMNCVPPVEDLAVQLGVASLKEGLSEEEAKERLKWVLKKRQKRLGKGMGKNMVVWRPYWDQTCPLPRLRYRVRRGGAVMDGVDLRELVPGDVVLLEAGQRVPGDSRVISLGPHGGAVLDDTQISGNSALTLSEGPSHAEAYHSSNRLFGGNYLVSGSVEILLLSIFPAVTVEQIYNYSLEPCPKWIDESLWRKIPRLLREKIPLLGLWIDRPTDLAVLWKESSCIIAPERYLDGTTTRVVDGILEAHMDLIVLTSGPDDIEAQKPALREVRSSRDKGGKGLLIRVGMGDSSYSACCAKLWYVTPYRGVIYLGAKERRESMHMVDWASSHSLAFSDVDDTPRIMDFTKGHGGLFLLPDPLEVLLQVKRFLSTLG